MKPIANETKIYYGIGDVCRGGVIIAFSPCRSADTCGRDYKNFDVTCTGFRRILEDGASVCIWYVTQDDLYLTDRVGGNPLL